jgi:hypothetical protein
MLLLRIGRLRRWDRSRDPQSAADVEEAARDLRLEQDERGLSVYRVDGETERREVAVRFAVTQRGEPQHLDFVVFPSRVATDLGLTVEHVACPGLDPYLNERHHEVLGLTPELTLRLAAAILADHERRVERVRERDLVTLAAALYLAHPQLRAYLKGSWPELLEGNPADPPSEG